MKRRVAWLGAMLSGFLMASWGMASASDLWKEDFIGGIPGNNPAGWYDASDDINNHAMIYYDATDSYADISVTAGDSSGKVLSFTQDVDLNVYPLLEIVVSSVPSGDLKVGVFSQTNGWEDHVNPGVLTAPNTYTFDIPTLTGWSGIKNMGIELFVEGAGGEVVIDSVRIFNTASSTPTRTSTMTFSPTCNITETPTPTPTISAAVTTNWWMEHFIGTVGQKLPGWEDATTNPSFNAQVVRSSIPYTTWGSITQTVGSWGKVLSPIQYCDTSIYPWMEIKVDNVGANTNWRIGIQENGGSLVYKDLNTDTTATGVFSFDYATAMGWTGMHAFQVQIAVVGTPQVSNINVDYVRVFTYGIPPTATPTPVVAEAWGTSFTGQAGAKPPGWLDNLDDLSNRMRIAYSCEDGYAYLSRTAGITYGKVFSPRISCNVSRYNYIQISVKSVSSGAKWKVGVQEESGYKWYADMSAAMALTGTITYNYPEIVSQANGVDWSGLREFTLVLIVEGPVGSTVELDSLSVFGYFTTPTVTVTPTQTFTFTATSIKTPEPYTTLSPSVYLKLQNNTDTTIYYTGGFNNKIVIRGVTDTILADFSPLEGDQYIYYANKYFIDKGYATVGLNEGGYLVYKIPLTTRNGKLMEPESIQEISGHLQVAPWATITNAGTVQLLISADGINFITDASLDFGGISPTNPINTNYTFTSVLAVLKQGNFGSTPTPIPDWIRTGEVAAYPNPAHGKVTFAYRMVGSGKVAIDIYRLTGERVAHIEERKDGGAGQTLTTAWEAAGVAPGVYFVRIVITNAAGQEVMNVKKKVALVK